MEPVSSVVFIAVMGGFFTSGYLLGSYLVKVKPTKNSPYLIRPRYNNIHNLIK
jgi:hypothetical protein